MKKSEAIKNFLKMAISPIAKSYNERMEVQVNVSQGVGVRENDKTKSPIYYDSNTGERWKSFRMPIPGNDANTDTQLNFDLVKHSEGIGMSGWNFVDKVSHWVGFDFDSLVNHKAGLTDEELTNIFKVCKGLPYVSVYKSTGGKGFHIYISFSTPFPTNTRAEHAAVAKALLQTLTADTGHNFQADVDCCGAILWCWHRKQEGTDGLSAIKYASEPFESKNIPPNWKDHIVEKGKRRKIYQGNVEELAVRVKSVKLEPAHQAVLKWFNEKAKHSWWWDNDYTMLVCHTLDLVSCHEELELQGTFLTESSGSSEHNAFCFPKFGGAWVVRRYSPGTMEHELWETDENGWTKTIFNIPLSFEKACIYRGGKLDRQDFYNFHNGRNMNAVFKDLNILYRVRDELTQKSYKLRLRKGKILISTEAVGDIPSDFHVMNRHYEKVLKYYDRYEEEEKAVVVSDEDIRHVVSNGTDAGWYVQVMNKWISHAKGNVQDVILYRNPTMNQKDAKVVLGEQMLSPWELTINPFQPEYPGGRRWNKGAAQFAVNPEPGCHETWLKIYKHLSLELDEPVKQNKWCQENDIKDGSDYLLTWVAFLFQKPKQPLPYLFFWSYAEDTGKSSFHESLRFLFKDDIGYVRADNSLKSQVGYNLELCGGVLCVVEETNLGTEKRAADKIKDFVTSPTVAIRAMYKDVFLVENTTHWVQTANGPGHCPIYPGDTRVISLLVRSLKEKIPKEKFFNALKSEASAFLYAVLNMNLPEPEGRLGLPTLTTTSKKEIQDSNETLLDKFIKEAIVFAKGHTISYRNFYNAFDTWMVGQDNKRRMSFTMSVVTKELKQSSTFFKAKWKGVVSLFNASLDCDAVDEDFMFARDEVTGRVIRKSNKKGKDYE